MKKLLVVLMGVMLFSFIGADKTISKKERKYATDLLQESRQSLEKAIAGLSDEQLKFQASDSEWSVEGNVKHLAQTEQTILGMIEDALKKPANPEKRADIKVSDEQMVKNYRDRSNKVKTISALEPPNISFASTAEALAALSQNREKAISFVNSTNEDLRNHVIEYPFGSYDCYQSVLILGSHMDRHIQQIEEIKSNPNFPKN
jgi:hypothetical protein